MRNVMVTGGTRGLGLGVARALAQAGFRVIAVARRQGDQLPAARAELRGPTCGELHYREFDLTDIDGISAFIKSAVREFGPFFGLVNNAAVGLSGILANTSNENIIRMVKLNVTSPLIVTKYLCRSMMTRRGGRIVNISSIVSTTGYSGLSAYSATKASLIGLTRSLARELGPLGITVNAVAPGFVETDLSHTLDAADRERIARRSALQRLTEVTDVANVVEFLFSTKARNITGTVVTVDAGGTA
jgi:3-oxoacyl-[acyl-carrier protein] reductase